MSNASGFSHLAYVEGRIYPDGTMFFYSDEQYEPVHVVAVPGQYKFPTLAAPCLYCKRLIPPDRYQCEGCGAAREKQ